MSSRCWNMCAFTQSWWLEQRIMSWTPPGKCLWAQHKKAHFPFFFVSVWFAFCGRWKKYEIHDIVIECAKVSLDPKEASCEEGYTTMPETFYPQVHLRPQDCTSSPFSDLHSSFGKSRYHMCLSWTALFAICNVANTVKIKKCMKRARSP